MSPASPFKGMRLRAKLLTAATLFNSSQLSTQDVTKLTAEDLTYLCNGWRQGSSWYEFDRIKLLKHWDDVGAARYLAVGRTPDDEEDEWDDGVEEIVIRGGFVALIEVYSRPKLSAEMEFDEDNFTSYTTYEEAVMEFATHGLE